MRRFLLAFTLVGTCFTVAGSAQTPQLVPQKYRNAAAPMLVAAAKAGDAEAMLWLGIKHSNNNQDVPRSDIEATRWFREAAEAGEPSGMYFAGIAFWSGRGVAKDMVEAYKWMELAAKHGNASLRDTANGVLEGLARVMSPNMISEAKVREAAWVRDFEKRKKV